MTEAPAGRIGPADWLRIALRTLGLLGLLLGCLPLYAIAAPFPGRNRVPRLFLSGVFRIVGGRIVVEGAPTHAPAIQAPAVLLANHVSWLDIPALAGATGTAFVAHDGLAASPLLRFLCRLNRTVFIARDNRASVAGQVGQVREGLDAAGILTLFPEGTTGDGVDLLPFKSALLAAIEQSGPAVAIRPVWIDYGALTAQIAWTGDEPGLRNAKRILARDRPFTVVVHLLEPLGPEQRRDRKTIAAAARDAIVERRDRTRG